MNPELKMVFARRSIRSYDNSAVSDDIIHDILEAGMAAPSACCKDPWCFVAVTSKDMLAQIAAGLPNGKMLATAPLGMVVCGNIDKAHDGHISYMLQDCSAAIQNMLLAAHALGLGACWLGVHPREDRIARLRALLDLPENIIPVSVLAMGRPAETKEARTRFDKAKVRRISD